MSGVKHTLHIEEGANSHFFDGRIMDDEGRCVAFVDLDAPVSRIFASAPDLLEALTVLRDNIVHAWPHMASLGPIQNASAAIARARGEQDGGGE